VLSSLCDFVVILRDFFVISSSFNFVVISHSCDFVLISPSCDFIVSLYVFRVHLFLSDIFCVNPFAFLGASFFIGYLLREPLCVFWVPLFSSDIFFVSPFAFLGCLFFHRRFFT
jgi:hypothetical protein